MHQAKLPQAAVAGARDGAPLIRRECGEASRLLLALALLYRSHTYCFGLIPVVTADELGRCASGIELNRITLWLPSCWPGLVVALRGSRILPYRSLLRGSLDRRPIDWRRSRETDFCSRLRSVVRWSRRSSGSANAARFMGHLPPRDVVFSSSIGGAASSSRMRASACRSASINSSRVKDSIGLPRNRTLSMFFAPYCSADGAASPVGSGFDSPGRLSPSRGAGGSGGSSIQSVMSSL
jgi:hypothetical protein